jgi:hypothetical protein
MFDEKQAVHENNKAPKLKPLKEHLSYQYLDASGQISRRRVFFTMAKPIVYF